MELLNKLLKKIAYKYIDCVYKSIDTNVIANGIMDVLSGIERENGKNVY